MGYDLLEVEHKHPVSRAASYDGDIDGDDNKVLSCPPCNQSKGVRTAEEYAKYLKGATTQR